MRLFKIQMIIILFCANIANGQAPVKNHYWAGSTEFIFSWGNMKIENTDVSSVLRFSGFLNYQSQFHYNFSKRMGIYTGLGIRNVGFINRLNDSIKIKQRVYAAGIPLALKLGDLEKSAYLAIGGEMELFFNYKQKTFYSDTKSKFDEWFSDRTELFNPSVFLEVKGKRGNYIRFKYYIKDFLKDDKQTVTVNNVVNTFRPLESKLFYISIGSTLKYKELKSKRSFREKKD